MAGQMLKRKDEKLKLLTDNELLDIAKQNGYTKQGEMFSGTVYTLLHRNTPCNEILNR